MEAANRTDDPKESVTNGIKCNENGRRTPGLFWTAALEAHKGQAVKGCRIKSAAGAASSAVFEETATASVLLIASKRRAWIVILNSPRFHTRTW
jgi:hypothetical protein